METSGANIAGCKLVLLAYTNEQLCIFLLATTRRQLQQIDGDPFEIGELSVLRMC